MCTVSYVPLAHGYLLTSSRDERLQRETLPPRSYRHSGQKIVYPKDAVSGGTWIAGCADETVACLLNGAFEKHEKKASQVTSRGKMFLESLEHEDFEEFIAGFDFATVEPFTLLMMKTHAFYELTWDGNDTYLNQLDKGKPKIWSSATLYSAAQRTEREKWFYQWITENSNYPDFDMLGFHSSHHGEDPNSDILMERPGGMQTVSITQIRNSLFSPSLIHVDLKAKKTYGPLFYTI
ncbi:Transport and Golgi organisation 2 [Cyclobacterium xiamenense]|uniref:Transport and Golgi organisation 2 n=1 Tax=Cyclobacterium xiamenense TaxID=1297121 RepID=A0A1H6W5L9_9BACT|nr:NRDE family protein [Cyclobacterium xiamenense]SEJ11066.1 Transport and Golgi organisation 2 [Cyclobacterium xiamenense]